MRLLILASYYLPEINAQSIRISQIAKGLSRKNKGIKIRVASFNPTYKNISEQMDEGKPSEEAIETIRYKRRWLPSYAFLPQSLSPLNLAYWICIAIKEIRGFDADLVMVTTPPFAPAIAVYIAYRIGGRKSRYVLDYRDDLGSVIYDIARKKRFPVKHFLEASNNLMSFLLTLSIKKASVVSTVNVALQKRLLNFNKNTILVPNGLDLQELDDVMKSFVRDDALVKNGIFGLDSKIIIFLGDLAMSYYFPDIILKPLKSIRSEGYNLIYIVVGDGVGRESLERQIEAMGLQDAVYPVGRKNHKEALKLLLASDIAFYPLQKDYPQAKHAIAAKVFEYVGCKLPILAIADECSAISEFVRTNGIGVALNWGELDRLEDALRCLLDSAEYKKNLDAKYSQFIEEFDRERGINLLFRSIKGIADAHASL